MKTIKLDEDTRNDINDTLIAMIDRAKPISFDELVKKYGGTKDDNE